MLLSATSLPCSASFSPKKTKGILIFKAILEAKYGKKVTDLYLVCLYPDNPSYQLIKVPNLEAEIKSLFELRRNQLSLTT